MPVIRAGDCLATRARSDGGTLILRATGDKLDEVMSVPLDDVSTTYIAGINRAGTATHAGMRIESPPSGIKPILENASRKLADSVAIT